MIVRAIIKTIKNQIGNSSISNMENTMVLPRFHFLKTTNNPKQVLGAKSSNKKVKDFKKVPVCAVRHAYEPTAVRQKTQHILLRAKHGSADTASRR